jgi:hypothetical protein
MCWWEEFLLQYLAGVDRGWLGVPHGYSLLRIIHGIMARGANSVKRHGASRHALESRLGSAEEWIGVADYCRNTGNWSHSVVSSGRREKD